MKAFLICATAALVLTASLHPSSADARRRGDDVVIAVWDVLADDMERGEASAAYARLADALDSVHDVDADRARDFAPDVRPSEGVVVAQRNATRWLDAAWIAYQRREWTVARGLLDDALALVEPYPHDRLPDGLRKELYLLKARTDLRGGNEFDGREALRKAMALDPAWEASPHWELDELVSLYSDVREETVGVPPARVSITTSVPGATILVGGIERTRSEGTTPVEILLPPGNHEITARLAGHASHTQKVFLVPRQELTADFFLEVRNTAGFQEQLADALLEPAAQRTTGIWRALDLAAADVGARGLLTGSYDGASQTLRVGLFFPQRQGWAWYGALDLGAPDAEARVDAAIEELMMTVDTTLHPQVDEIATR
jgi:hypothetical protein